MHTMHNKQAADTCQPSMLLNGDSGVVKCVVGYKCYMICCGLLSTGSSRAALQELSHI